MIDAAHIEHIDYIVVKGNDQSLVISNRTNRYKGSAFFGNRYFPDTITISHRKHRYTYTVHLKVPTVQKRTALIHNPFKKSDCEKRCIDNLHFKNYYKSEYT